MQTSATLASEASRTSERSGISRADISGPYKESTMRAGTVVILASAVSAMIGSCTGPPSSANSVQPALTDAERSAVVETIRGWADQWSGAFVSRDFSILDEILAPDFIYTLDNGDVHGKASFIALLENEPITYSRFEASDVEAHWYGDNVVVLIGTQETEGRDADGNPQKSRGRWTNVYVNRAGTWQCVVGHSTDIEG